MGLIGAMTGAGYVLMVRTTPDTEQYLKDHPEEAARMGKIAEQNRVLMDVVRASAGQCARKGGMPAERACACVRVRGG
jgi:hypothetical protein